MTLDSFVELFHIEDRAVQVTDANGVTVTNTYDNLGRLLSRTSPDTGVEKWVYTLNVAEPTSYTNQTSKVWAYTYDAGGRKTKEIGVGIHTNSFTYNSASDLLTLTDGKTNVTTWNYDQYGRVTNKLDQAGVEILRYTYDANSRLTSRWSKDKLTTSYTYDNMGNLTSVDYSYSPDVTLQYDALDRRTNMVDTTGTTKFAYYAGGLLASEDGPWSNDTVSYTYNNRHRASLSVQQPNGSWTNGYTWDGAHRLGTETSPAGTFTYSYIGAGSLVKKLGLPNTSYITNTFDSVGRLTGTYLDNNLNVVLNKHLYTYNTGNQRTQETRTDGSTVNYSYDNVGQLTVGDSSVASEDRGYLYDAAFNLNARTNGSAYTLWTYDGVGRLRKQQEYTWTSGAGSTALASSVSLGSLRNNFSGWVGFRFAVGGAPITVTQLGRWVVSGNSGSHTVKLVDSGGNDVPSGSVTVNTSGAPSGQFAYATLANAVTLSPGATYVVMSQETNGGDQWYDYNCGVTLTSVATPNQAAWANNGGIYVTTGATTNSYGPVNLKYTTGTWTLGSEARFVYDGRRVIQERDSSNTPTVSYTRGSDLSGTLEGAGGIGGLLARSHGYSSGTWSTSNFYHADGNGNVTYMVNSSQSMVASYRYDPYGNTISSSGTLVSANVYRFSSKQTHSTSGMYYYGFRFYDPNLQRWPNRDPINELGFNLLVANDDAFDLDEEKNLYAMVFNDPIDAYDAFGRSLRGLWSKPCSPGEEKICKQMCEERGLEMLSCRVEWKWKRVHREYIYNYPKD